MSDDAAGSHFKVNGFEYTIAMPGLFNIENAAAAIACGLLAGFAPEQIALGLRDVRVPGRSELISTADEKIHFFVDYAHNMLSFEKALEALRKLYRGAKIVTLFGAPGNKAYNRRRDLPEVAARFSDEIYVVPEDTDTEDPAEISREIAQYIPDNIPCTIFADRESGINAAFEKAVSDLQSGSTVEYVFFAAGKGREAFLKLNGGYLPYIGDYEVVKKLIARYDTETAV
ncbi:cyanophycin synthetase [Arcanobacterium hippocoleae]